MTEIIKTVAEWKKVRKLLDFNRASLGFVPTMGALHKGHLSLIRESRKDNDITVCSVFVNPNQFNNPNDLKNYPRDFDRDLEMLQQEKCDAVFHPSVEVMYPSPPNETFDFGELDKVMEGAFRPGHFNGVATVVKRLFEIVRPGRAYFGLKDYQQLVIIHKMTTDLGLPVEIVPCSIVREKDGLAMSSRNQLLSEAEKKQALLLHKTLKFVKVRAGFATISEIKEYVDKQFRKQKNIKLEYFEIVDMYSLKTLRSWAESNHAIACIAAWVGKVRLIDNIILFS